MRKIGYVIVPPWRAEEIRPVIKSYRSAGCFEPVDPRGPLKRATFAWGDEFNPHGRKMANVWDGTAQPFPVIGPSAAAERGTSRVCSFPLNGYGLCDITGNVWQWVADWYRSDAFNIESNGPVPVDPQGPHDSYDPDEPGIPANAPKRVIRGGSFLCSREYCVSYRPSARRGADPLTSMSHIGFRLVSDKCLCQPHRLRSNDQSPQANTP